MSFRESWLSVFVPVSSKAVLFSHCVEGMCVQYAHVHSACVQMHTGCY